MGGWDHRGRVKTGSSTSLLLTVPCKEGQGWRARMHMWSELTAASQGTALRAVKGSAPSLPVTVARLFVSASHLK